MRIPFDELDIARGAKCLECTKHNRPLRRGWLDLTDCLSFVGVRYHVTLEQFVGFQMAVSVPSLPWLNHFYKLPS